MSINAGLIHPGPGLSRLDIIFVAIAYDWKNIILLPLKAQNNGMSNFLCCVDLFVLSSG